MAKIAEVQEVAVSLLKPYERNAKIHGQTQIEKLKDSINEFGFLTPCLIDREYNIIAGHGRVIAAKELNMTTVPCVFVEGLTDAQRRAYILADNRLGELGEWDMEIVTSELMALDDMNFDVSLTGFELDIDEGPEEIIEDEIPEKAESRCKLGDIWQLGDHRLICGDSTDIAVIDKLMCGKKTDISITSPPYGAKDISKIRTHYVRGAETRKSFYDEHEDAADGWIDLIQSAFDVMTTFSTAQFVNIQMLAGNKRQLIEFVHNNAEMLCDVIVWDKKVAPPQMQKNILNNQYEFVFVFGSQSKTIPFGNFHGNQSNVIRQTTGQNKYADIHRAVFPVELPSKVIDIASEAKTVLDVFGGTGTTLIACEQLNRKCFMCELSPQYCDVIIQRWENLTGKKAVITNG